jgi:hypothetical protein
MPLPVKGGVVRPDRLVQYSLVLERDDWRPDLIWQFATSIRTLREHNRSVPVVLFLYGGLTPELAGVCLEHGVMVHQRGRYEHRLAELCPTGWPALARYPLLHKLMNFGELAAVDPVQVLCCDCDTVFLDDVEVLFDRYAGADVVAREEVHSGRSAYGVDRSFIDEPLLARLAAHDGIAPAPPFNLGVVLLNNHLWRRLAPLDRLLVDYAWRLVTWMGQHPATGEAERYGEFMGAAEAQNLAGSVDLARALPYPSVNRWILDEVAFWLTLGHLPGVGFADFRRDDVAQNGEFGASDVRSAPWIVCHYYSQNMRRIDAWLQQQSVLTAA